MDSHKVIVTEMKPRERHEWKKDAVKKKSPHYEQRLLKKGLPLAAVVLCLGTAVALHMRGGDSAVMSHVSAGFEYDNTLGRLQFVSNILPESAMVFLNGSDEVVSVIAPVQEEAVHAWSQTEPWLEYACAGEVLNCLDGEIMTVVRNRKNEYTVRVLHDGGYESVYSGLKDVAVEENNWIKAGQPLGMTSGFAAFELRKDGLSVMPVFHSNAH